MGFKGITKKGIYKRKKGKKKRFHKIPNSPKWKRKKVISA